MTKHMTFGEIIKKTREQNNLSQETLAKNIKEKYNVRISTSYLSMIETNTRTNLTVKLINALLQHLNLPREAVFSLFANLQQPMKHVVSSGTNAAHEAQTPYTANKNPDIGGGLPPEAQKPLNEIYVLLMDKYNKDDKKIETY